MEAELHRLKAMNEQLFQSSAHMEEQLEVCTGKNHMLTQAN